MTANEPGQPMIVLDQVDVTRDFEAPQSVLAIGAHPDDVEFGAGGTLAKWAAAGCVVHHLVCTDGSKGTWDPHADIGALVARRQHEQREAARRIAGDNAGEVVFLGYVDGELDSGLEARSRVARGSVTAPPRRRAGPRSLEAIPHPSRPPPRRAARV